MRGIHQLRVEMPDSAVKAFALGEPVFHRSVPNTDIVMEVGWREPCVRKVAGVARFANLLLRLDPRREGGGPGSKDGLVRI